MKDNVHNLKGGINTQVNRLHKYLAGQKGDKFCGVIPVSSSNTFGGGRRVDSSPWIYVKLPIP